jgi:hypothetical protein
MTEVQNVESWAVKTAAKMLQLIADYFKGRNFEWWILFVRQAMLYMLLLMATHAFSSYMFLLLFFGFIFPALHHLSKAIDEKFLEKK